MAITMYVNDDRTASGSNTVSMTVLGLAFVMLAVLVFRPLSRHSGEPSPP